MTSLLTRVCALLAVALVAPATAGAVPKLKSVQSLAAPGARVTLGPVVGGNANTGVQVAVWAQGSRLVSAVKPSESRPFGAPKAIGAFAGVSRIQLVGDEGGNQLLVLERGGNVEALYRPAGPRTAFGAPQVLGQGSGADGGMAKDGTAVVAWTTPAGIGLAVRLSEKKAFEAVDPVAAPNASSVSVGIDPSRQVLLSWVQDGAVRFRGGGGRPVDLGAEGATRALLGTGVDGDVRIVWRSEQGLFSRSRPRGQDTDLRPIEQPGPRAPVELHDIAVDLADDVLAIYGQAGRLSAAFARGGETFESSGTEPLGIGPGAGPVSTSVGSDSFLVAYVDGGRVTWALRRRGTGTTFQAPRALGPGSAPAAATDGVGGGTVVWRGTRGRLLAATDFFGGDRTPPRVTRLSGRRYVCDEFCTLRFRRGARRFAKATAQPGVAVRPAGRGTLEARDRRGNLRRLRP